MSMLLHHSLRLVLPCLSLALLSACQSTAQNTAISQYICTNGSIARASLNDDKSSLRLSLGGSSRTLRWDEKLQAYSNGKMSVTVDERLLRVDAPGSRLNCSLQIPANAPSPADGNPPASPGNP